MLPLQTVAYVRKMLLNVNKNGQKPQICIKQAALISLALYTYVVKTREFVKFFQNTFLKTWKLFRIIVTTTTLY